MTSCPACGEANPDRAKFCLECGAPLVRDRAFGNVPEEAYARLGRGRCLIALGEPGAEGPLRVARRWFESLGYRPALAMTEALLAGAA